MYASQIHWKKAGGWTALDPQSAGAGLVLYFGDRDVLAEGAHYTELRERFPGARILGCSTGGQMQGADVSDDAVTALVLTFAETELRTTCGPISGAEESFTRGQAIGQKLRADDLAGIFVLSDGLKVNGSALVEGIVSIVGREVKVSGGLAGDSGQFVETLVGCDGKPVAGNVAAVGFYGDAIQIGNGCAGGWDVFGPMRRITRSHGNVLLEVDGKPALDLYKLYLGPDDSQRLPGSGLLFPIRVYNPKAPAEGVVRTILGVDHETGSMTFAGDMPEGWSAQLMRGAITRLCDGAAQATQQAVEAAGLEAGASIAAIFVSCIGRRLLMGQRIDEEIEAANAELGTNCVPVGFYSFGEISPSDAKGFSQLHNQTMTVTVIGERAGMHAT